jgi:VanZ family protein
MAMIFVLSARPGQRVLADATLDLVIKQGAHLVLYFVLAALLARAVHAAWPALSLPTVLSVAVAGAVLYGVTDEVHQLFVPRRDASLLDLGFDLVGALAAAAVIAVGSRWRERRASPPDSRIGA